MEKFKAWTISDKNIKHIGTLKIGYGDFKYDYLLPLDLRRDRLIEPCNKYDPQYVDLFYLPPIGYLHERIFSIEKSWIVRDKIRLLLSLTTKRVEDLPTEEDNGEGFIGFPDSRWTDFFVVFDIPAQPLLDLLAKHNFTLYDLNQSTHSDGDTIKHRYWLAVFNPKPYTWTIDLYMLTKTEKFIETSTIEELLDKIRDL